MRPTIDAMAAELAQAWRSATTTSPPSRQWAGLDRPTAYRIQEVAVAALGADHGRRVGWKLGLNTRSALEPPFTGPIHEAMVFPSETTVPLDRTIHPYLELEVAVIAGDVPRLAAAFEVVDSRLEGEATVVDSIADFANTRFVVVGDSVEVPDSILDAIGHLGRDGGEMTSGAVRDHIGHPVESIHWLEAHLAELGHALAAGDVVITGSLIGQVEARPGRYTGSISGLPLVSAVFT